MPFVGDRNWRLLDYRAVWTVAGRAVEVAVRWGSGEPDADALFAAEIDGFPHPIDDEEGLLSLAPEGAVVTFERGGVAVEMWREAGHIRARASASIDGASRTGPVADGIEAALYGLGEVDPRRAAPERCFYCAHSDYEPSTGFGGGHLACFVASADEYRAIATSESAWDRKYGAWGGQSLAFRWVDELDTCPLWQRRPRGHGYRG
jgi:hypothetical protein